MVYTITWKDGSKTQMDDSEFTSMPKEMEKDIGDITQDTTTPSKPTTQPISTQPLPTQTEGNIFTDVADKAKELASGYIKSTIDELRQHPTQAIATATAPWWGPASIGTGALVGGLVAGGTNVADKALGRVTDGFIGNKDLDTKTLQENFDEAAQAFGIGSLFGGLGPVISKVIKGAHPTSTIREIDEALETPIAKEFTRLQKNRPNPPTIKTEWNPESNSLVEVADFTPTKVDIANKYGIKPSEVSTFEAAKERKLWEEAKEAFEQKSKTYIPDKKLTPEDKLIERLSKNNPWPAYFIEKDPVTRYVGSLIGDLNSVTNEIPKSIVPELYGNQTLAKIPYGLLNTLPSTIQRVGQAIATRPGSIMFPDESKSQFFKSKNKK